MADNVLHEETRSPIRGTGEPTSFSKTRFGFSPKDPFQILTGQGQTMPKGVLPILRQGAGNVFGALGETIAEGVHIAGHGIGAGISAIEDVQAAVRGSGPGTAFREFVKGPDAPSVREGGQFDGMTNEEIIADVVASQNARDQLVDPEELTSQAGHLIEQRTILDQLANDPTMTEASRFAIEQAREALGEQMADLELDLERSRQQLRVQDTLFNFQADQLGLDLDLAPLEEAIQREGGLGAQTLLAITAIANDAALSAQEKNEALDIVMARGQFSDAIVREVESMVQNKDDLQQLLELNDTQLAGRLGNPAQFFSPTFENVTVVDPVLRAGAEMDTVIDRSELAGVVAGLDPNQDQLYFMLVDAVRNFGVDNPQSIALMDQMAKATQTDPSQWRDVLGAAVQAVADDAEAFERAQDAPKLTPGDKSMTYAIGGAGKGIGLDDTTSTLLANSVELHAMIQVKSNGVAGHEGPGNIRGIGGLHEDLYPQLMFDEQGNGEKWTPDRGMEWELQALLAYIIRHHGGDPIAAIDFYRNTGQWGGVASFEAVDSG